MAKNIFVTKLLVRRLPDLPDRLLRLWAKNALLCSNKQFYTWTMVLNSVMMPIQCDVPMPAIFLLRFADAIIIDREGLASQQHMPSRRAPIFVPKNRYVHACTQYTVVLQKSTRGQYILHVHQRRQ